MAGAINHRHHSTLPAGTGDVRSTEWNDSLVMSGGSDGQFAMRDAASADGWKWSTVSVTPAADSVSIVRGSATGNYNLSTLGTFDWIYPAGQTSALRTLGNGVGHQKQLGGGWLWQSFEWIMTGSPTIFSQNFTASVTTSAGDDTNSAAASSAVSGQGCFTTAGTTYGFRMMCPLTARTNTLVVICSSFTCDTRFTAQLNGQTQLTATNDFTGVPSAGAEQTYTVTATTTYGGWLAVSFKLTAAEGVNLSPNVKFLAAYLS